MEKFLVWLKNAKTFHHRIMMNYLKKRGWVVFYLEEKSRVCNGENSSTCWLSLYQQEEKRNGSI